MHRKEKTDGKEVGRMVIRISPFKTQGYASYFCVLPYDTKLDKLAAMPEIATLWVDGYSPKITECREKG